MIRTISLIKSGAVLCLLFCVIAIYVDAQEVVPAPAAEMTSPAEEKFTPSTDLVSTWMGCLWMPDDRPEHGCAKLEYSEEAKRSKIFTLYESDGSVWWQAHTQNHPQHAPPGIRWFNDDRKLGFEPLFATSESGTIVLRMVGESENWFEVEINEETRKTKYVHKRDPAWSKTTWDFFLRLRCCLILPDGQVLLDAPDGNRIDPQGGRIVKKVNALKRDGDWLYVQEVLEISTDVPLTKGWIRWRDGREVLIGYFLNGLKPPGK